MERSFLRPNLGRLHSQRGADQEQIVAKRTASLDHGGAGIEYGFHRAGDDYII